MRSVKTSNSLAIASLVVSILAAIVGVGGTAMTQTLEAQKKPDRQYAGGDASFVTDKAGNALAFGGQVLVFLVSNAISLTLASVAAIMGFVAVSQDGSNLAVAGILISALSIVWAFW